MQTTTRKSWLDSGQIKIALLFLGVAVLLVIGAISLTTQRANDAAVNVGANDVSIVQPSSPVNAQVESDETSVMSIRESRFHDWNTILPNSGAQPALPTGDQGQRH